jgi:uridine phosphorylase
MAALQREAPEPLESQASVFMMGGTSILRGKDHFLAGPVLGAPMAVMALEILIGGGAKNVLYAGFAGSLAGELKAGDLFVPSSAFSTEGTSAHYPAALEPDPDLHARLAGCLRGGGAASRGAVWSTDGPFREVRELRDAFKARGALAVEMVVSALFAAAGFRGLALAAALLVTDEFLPDGSWREGFRDPGFPEGLAALSKGVWRAFV